MRRLRENEEVSTQKTLETLGTYSINRPIGRMFELAAGVSADKRGNLINDDTRTAMSYTARLMSLRPLIEQKNIETNARIANTESYQSSIHDRADGSLRALFRSQMEPKEMDNKVSHIIMDYVGHGGNPGNIGELIRDTAISAVITKQDKKLFEVLNNPSRLNDVLRLVNNINEFRDD